MLQRLIALCAAVACGLVASSQLAVAGGEAATTRVAPAPRSILFVGNSFTYYNNSLHMHTRELAKSILAKHDESKAQALYTKAMTISGARLADHALGAKGMITRFRSQEQPGAWDVVVLQGFSREPIEDAGAMAFRDSARELDSWIRAAGSTTVLFMTWAYQDHPEMTEPLARAYTDLGRELDALVVPVGLAFARGRAENPRMGLHDPDGRHPSRLGSYLAANVFFAALYGESPVGASYIAGLEPEAAAFAQDVAWRTVQDYFGAEGFERDADRAR